jgi:high-affinity nickel-transport protein
LRLLWRLIKIAAAAAHFDAMDCTRMPMEPALIFNTGLGLMFLLGLRHGFDPDHIAMIDAMAYRAFGQRPLLAPWTGTLFALGHGLAVTAIAVGLGAWTTGVALPALAQTVLDWLPTTLLVLVGAVNLHGLLRRRAYTPRGWKSRFLPRRLQTSSHPLAIFGVGVLFALVFDTATQAAAWGVAAGSDPGSGAAAGAHAGGAMALLAGLAFTLGMVITDTLDGHIVVRLLRQASGAASMAAHRRRIGWVVVVMSFALAAYDIATRWRPHVELGDLALTIIGATLVGSALVAYTVARRQADNRIA